MDYVQRSFTAIAPDMLLECFTGGVALHAPVSEVGEVGVVGAVGVVSLVSKVGEVRTGNLVLSTRLINVTNGYSL